MCSLCQVNDLRQKAPFAEYIMIILAVPKSADSYKIGTCSLIPSLSRWCDTCIIIMYITNTIIIKVFGQISKKFEPGDAMQKFFSFLHKQAVKVSSMNYSKHTIE